MFINKVQLINNNQQVLPNSCLLKMHDPSPALATSLNILKHYECFFSLRLWWKCHEWMSVNHQVILTYFILISPELLGSSVRHILIINFIHLKRNTFQNEPESWENYKEMNLYANNPIKHTYSFGIQWGQRQSSIDITISYKIPNEFKNISKLSSNITVTHTDHLYCYPIY